VLSSYHAHAGELDWKGDRERLAGLLLPYLRGLGAPRASLDAVSALGRPGAVAVVAGHQPGLFGGPLFLALKILSVLNLCDRLNEEGGKVCYVPVYWNGSEDHNPSEFGRCSLYDREHDLKTFSLGLSDEERMAAATGVDEARELLLQVGAELPDTEFKAGLIEELSECLVGNLGESMSRLMLRWFGERGLVVVEPHILRPLSVPVLTQALREPQAVYQGMAEDLCAMESRGYKAPLPLQEVDRTLVYSIGPDGSRSRLRFDQEMACFRSEQGGRVFSLDELLAEVARCPDRFGPCAALRPIVQAAVLPVVAYVAGGGELAYHLQLRSLFRHFDVSLPLIVPRAAATLLKKNLLKTLSKLGLDEESLLSPGWEWEEIARNSSAAARAREDAFAGFRDVFLQEVEGLRASLSELGHAKLGDLSREEASFLKRLNGMEKRLSAADPTSGAEARRQYYRLRKFVLPREGLQEICISTLYFRCLYGPSLLTELGECIDPLSPLHHLVILE
jgi:bacillithiol biosynthesis cysteine-adding enzyme BshC